MVTDCTRLLEKQHLYVICVVSVSSVCAQTVALVLPDHSHPLTRRIELTLYASERDKAHIDAAISTLADD